MTPWIPAYLRAASQQWQAADAGGGGGETTEERTSGCWRNAGQQWRVADADNANNSSSFVSIPYSSQRDNGSPVASYGSPVASCRDGAVSVVSESFDPIPATELIPSSEISLCRGPDGRAVCLGEGGYGKVPFLLCSVVSDVLYPNSCCCMKRGGPFPMLSSFLISQLVSQANITVSACT